MHPARLRLENQSQKVKLGTSKVAFSKTLNNKHLIILLIMEDSLVKVALKTRNST